MAQVTVRNLNKYPFEQKHRNGTMYRFEAHGEPGDSVTMDEEDANLYLGQKSPIVVDNKGNHDPQFFKMLRIEADPKAVKKDRDSKPICPVCREQTSSWLELEAHQRLMHSDQLVKDSEYEAYLEQKAKANAKATGAGAPKG